MSNEQLEQIREQFLYRMSQANMLSTTVDHDERSLEIFAETFKSLMLALNDLDIRLDKDEINDLILELREEIKKPVRDHAIYKITQQN
jgi:hypothetical protein